MSATEVPVRVYCLGHFHAEKQGAPLDETAGAQAKPLALLKTLVALGGEHVPVEQITEALWPDSEGDAAYRAFTSALHRLRQLLGPDAVPIGLRRLSLDGRLVWSDCREVNGLLGQAEAALNAREVPAAQQAIARAADLYLGPFLEGEFDPPDILVARDKLHSRFLRTLRETAHALGRNGGLPDAIRLYEKGIEIDPVAEELVQALLQGYGQSRRHVEAEQAYQRLCRNLAAHGAGRPSAETEAAREEAARIAPAAQREDSSAPLRQNPSAPPSPEPKHHAAGALPPWRSLRFRMGLLGVALIAGVVVAAFLAKRPAAPPQDSSPDALLVPADRPSIAVMPFVNMSGDPKQDYFADGLTETLITDLSQLRDLLVIASNTAFTYKEKAVDVRQVGRELGVRHVLEGSVQKVGGRVRVSAQLIEAASADHVWAERWDRPADDIFAVQDEITNKIVVELDVKLIEGEQSRLWRRATNNAEAFDLYLRGLQLVWRFTEADNMTARRLLEQAVQLDPKFTTAMATIGWTYVIDGDWGWGGESQLDSWERGIVWGERALAADDSDGQAYLLLGDLVKDHRRDIPRGIQLMEQAVALNPNWATGLVVLGWHQSLGGRAEAGLENVRKGIRLNPYPPGWYFAALGDGYLWTGQTEKAIETHLETLRLVPYELHSKMSLIVALGMAGRLDEAKVHALEMRRMFPNFSMHHLPYSMTREQTEAVVTQLREAGFE